MSWTVNFYPKETEKFLEKIDKQRKGLIIGELKILQTFGFSQHNDSLKKMAGLSDVWELKVKQYRIFLTQISIETIQILHIIIKKSNKTPLEEINLIKYRAKYFRDAQ